LGATHSQTPDVVFSHFPGLKVVAPATPADAKGLLKSAIRDEDPVFFIEHATLYQVRGEVPDDEDYLVPIGVSDVKREGDDVTIVSYSKMLQTSLEAADQLAEGGIEAEVIDLRTLRPLDTRPIVESVQKTNRMVVVEEGWRAYGIGAEIASRVTELAFDYLDAPVRRVAQAEVPLPYNQRLEQMALPQVEHIVDAVKDVLYLNE
jgi:pyruvate dehydrogenase E1 component beta subunit